MESNPERNIDPQSLTGVDDVRHIREKIASQYDGDLRKHVAETNRIVEPLIEKLGLKRGTPISPVVEQAGAKA